MRCITALLLGSVLWVACGDGTGPVTLTLISHESFADAVTEETFASFTEETGVGVEVLAAGDTGGMVNQAILTKDNPIADVLFGIDDTFLARAQTAGIFEGEEVAIDYGDVCVNYDKEAFPDGPPNSLDQLPALADQLVVEDPSLSSPGLAFLLATIERYGEGWIDYWTQLRDNGVLVAPSWNDAYYGEFSGGAGEGDRPLVVSYASSPPAEVIFSETPLTEPPTGVMTDGCYRQTEFAAVLAGTEHPDEARSLIEFLRSPEFQATIPLTWFVYPAVEGIELPPEFVENTAVPTDPISMDPALIEQNREQWLEEWADIFG
jgi:thiamine transport system substrate-binding protein